MTLIQMVNATRTLFSLFNVNVKEELTKYELRQFTKLASFSYLTQKKESMSKNTPRVFSTKIATLLLLLRI